MNGTIKRLVRDKGSACVGVRFDDLHEGQAITFDAGQGPKGPRAEHIRVVA